MSFWSTLLGLRSVPPLSRPNYAAEWQQIALWGVLVGATEGAMASVIAAKTFHASDFQTALIWSIPLIMNVLNVGWSAFIRGRPRKRTFVGIVLGAVLSVASIGLTSTAWGRWAPWVFALQMAATHLFVSGMVTLRATFWSANYPLTHRARIAGRLQMVRTLLLLLTSAALGLLFDHEPAAYRLVYPVVALVALASLIPFRRIRMRGEPLELRRFQERMAQRGGRWSGGVWDSLRAGVRESWEILRQDRVYANYMLAQFLLGSSNFLTDPVVVVLLTKDLGLSYFNSLALLHIIPTVVLLVSLRFWAPLFDGEGVIRFRIYNSACWVWSYVTILVAAGLLALAPAHAFGLAMAVLIAGRVLNGLGRGGGAIAWNIGHLHFSGEHQAELYMGIHVALTGLRGLIMPHAGLLANNIFGWWSFGLAVAVGLVAHHMFRRMARQDTGPAERLRTAAAKSPVERAFDDARQA